MCLVLYLLALFMIESKTENVKKCTWLNINSMFSRNNIIQPKLGDFEKCLKSCLEKKESECKYGVDWFEKYPFGERCRFSLDNELDTNKESSHYFCSEFFE